jgi:hypothetical protein
MKQTASATATWDTRRSRCACGIASAPIAKALAAMAILQVQGLSEHYNDTDERFRIRLGA